MQAGGGFQSALALFKRADERAAGLISRASIRHLFRSLGFHDGDVENILQSVGCPQEDPVMYEPLLRWVFGEVAADKSDYSDQISPSQYIGLLREGQSVGLDRLHSLRGRLCRGREPKHFATLGHGMSCFVLGAEGLKLFLDAAARNDGDGAPLEMLLTIGYDILDIYEKLQAGWVFDLVVWKAVDYDPPCATWEGVASTLESVYPVAAEHMRVHLAELQQRGSGVSSPAGYAALQAQHRPEVNGYTFRADASQLKYEDFCALASAGKCSASMVRKFLYDSIGLNDLYAGTGYTILADGSRGITEYIALNMRRGDLQHEATALGAPTVTECLTRISKMYEVLITQSSGLQSFHLSRWLPAEEIPPAGTGRRISPSPKDVADMFRRGERFSPGTVLDGLCCRLQVGKDASWFATTAGQVKWGRKVSLVGASDQILRFLESPRALDCLLLAGLTLSDALFYVKTGRGVQLTICR
ncbi:unnamed protein product [Prorocentrum cordatum]|uniref:Uncharacterized protein n=1 Tax=Prorocentrum cordatum TaxID=2364126 RepID=A0ABN9SSK5_9DINO|nr:unnamed protein product [Polarella glacialis]